MKPELKQLIILALGLDAAADDAAIETALTTHLQKIADDKKASDNPNKDKPPGEQAQPPPNKDAAANDKIVSDLNAALAAANEQTAALRETRVDLALDHAVSHGLIAANERRTQRETLLACANEAALGTALSELRTRRPVLQMHPTHAASLAGQRPIAAANDDTERAAQRTAAVNKILTDEYGYNLHSLPTGARDHAWSIAASRNADLFSH
ncbi:MAG: hypothetical protein V4662_17720 [Verrucomicrobiota bacterium]